jgi:hypothetical protein
MMWPKEDNRDLTSDDVFDLHRVAAVVGTLMTGDERTRLCHVLNMTSVRLDELCNLALQSVTFGPGSGYAVMPNLVWRIRCRLDIAGEAQYWSNKLGWTEQRLGDFYAHHGRDTLSLPDEGVWEEADFGTQRVAGVAF